MAPKKKVAILLKKRKRGGGEGLVETLDNDSEESDVDEVQKSAIKRQRTGQKKEEEGKDGDDNDDALIFDPHALDKILQLPKSSAHNWCLDKSHNELQFGPTFQVGSEEKIMLKIVDIVLFNKGDVSADKHVMRKLVIMKRYYKKSNRKHEYFTVDVTRRDMREFMHGVRGLIKMVAKSEKPSLEGFVSRADVYYKKKHRESIATAKAGISRIRIL